MSVMINNGLWSLKKAKRQLDAAHREACNALACFDTDRADNSLPVEERIAARSLLDQMVPLCQALREAMNAIPEAVLPKPEIKLPCTRTAKSLLDQFKAKKRGPLATSVNYGHPIAVAISCLLLCAIPFQSKASSLQPEASRSIERVIDALVIVESSGRPAVIGDSGKAVGLLQLHPVAVREANRIAGERRWKLADRTCPMKSRAMARTTLVWHYRRGCTDPVGLGCRWKFPYSEASAEYRAKVEAALACN